jgi:hypothetical protein
MYSEAFQDEFVDIVLKDQKQGYFVDVGGGCHEQKGGSNTLMFEEKGWKGIIVDVDPNRMVGRSCICAASWIGDGSENSKKLGDVLKENNVPNLIDYLSIDIEGQDFNALKSFIDSGFISKVVTIEHNVFLGNPEVTQLKANIFNLLTLNGYVRIVDNAGNCANAKNFNLGIPFEDWYINLKHINYSDTIQRIKALQKASLQNT